MERYYQTLKREVNQLPYEVPSQLELVLAEFANYYNFHRYHIALGDVTPADVIQGQRAQIRQRRKEMQTRTIQVRRSYNRALRKLSRLS
jgi:transposase InsO family protein